MKSYTVKVFGCQMNKHDGEKIDGLLNALGYEKENDITKADLAVYYTCCVRKSADERFYGQLSSTKHKMRSIIAVGGCLAQAQGETLLRKFKKIDIVFGTQNLKELPNLINKANNHAISDIGEGKGFSSDLPTQKEFAHKAWVAVNRGCDNHCSYCIVPAVRGPEVSRKMEAIEKEVQNLVEDEVREVTLLGQNVNSYGRDIYLKPSFEKLLSMLSDTDISRIRFTTSHPKDLSDEIIKEINENNKICEHIHLPVQAGSNRILKIMGRHYTKESYLHLIERIRQGIHKVSITTDIMVGFPGETQKDFDDTLDIVEKAQFDQAFTFIYSKRNGTKAAKLTDDVGYEDKLKRFKSLVKIQDEVSYKKNKEMVGKIESVLVDGVTKKDKAMLSGRTRNNKLVHFKSDSTKTGSFVNVKISEAKPFYLIGEIDG